jgi:mRNA deadenylase 3'-5' endonuclease subunit Ccr4
VPFTVATYNVLADSYVRGERYPHAPPELLDPARRRGLLLDHLVGLDADVVCLQEVEPAAFAAIADRLSSVGYSGSYCAKAGRRPDGCATFQRDATFTRRAEARLEYEDAPAGEPRSGHVAHLVALDHAGGRLGIANTHLKWDPPDTPVELQYGCRQAAQLLLERDRRLPECDGWILCGDFNVTPESEVVALIEGKGLRSAYAEHGDAPTASVAGRAKTIDYLFHGSSLRADPFPVPSLTGLALPGPGQPSDHIALVARFRWVREEAAIGA